MTAYPKVWLKAGREKSLRRRHPWVFSGAIERVEGQPAAGATVELVASSGEPGLTGETRAALAELTSDVDIKVFSTPT